MKSIKLILIFACITVISETSAQNGSNSSIFHPPLDIPLRLSGNFGELRSDHFHAGIDFKTQGATGKPVYAIADGYVSRIRVSANGYGHALYIHHPDEGVTSVYGHLQSFNEKLERYVTRNQYRQKTFEIQLFPEKGTFRVKKGERVGISGNSGSSEGPHLHFEIRNIDNQVPLNPLKYPFDITDHIPPKIFNIALYPAGNHSMIDGRPGKKIIDAVALNTGRYGLRNNPIPEVSGTIGFGIRAYDFLNGAPNWCGLYTVKLYVDSTLMYHHKMDRFSFHETRYINSLIDYEEDERNNRTFQKSFRQPNNRLSIYEYLRNEGLFSFKDDTIHTVTYRITDAYDNTSELSFRVKSTPQLPDTIRHANGEEGTIMPYNKKNSFQHEDIRLNFPLDAFYDTISFTYHKEAPPFDHDRFYSDLHHVHNPFTPVHKRYTLAIKPRDLPEMLRSKAFIARVNGEDSPYVYEGGEVVNDFISTRVREFGKYAVMVDREPPSVEPLIINRQKISFKIDDELTGIMSYNGYINGEWVLFEYDPKNDLLTYHIDRQRLKKADRYELELYVSDHVNNISTYHDTINID